MMLISRSKQEADDDVDIKKQEADDDVDIKKQARSR